LNLSPTADTLPIDGGHTRMILSPSPPQRSREERLLNKSSKRPNALLSLIVWLLPNSSFKHWARRRMGHEIGKNVTISPNFIINCGYFRIDDGAMLLGFNTIRNLRRFELGHDSVIGRVNTFTAAPAYQRYSEWVGLFRMGPYGTVTSRHYLDCSGQVIIGFHAGIAGLRCILQSHTIDLIEDVNTVGRIFFDDYTAVMTGCLVLKDAYLPPRSILAAGSVLGASRPDAELREGMYAGSPAKHVRDLPYMKWYDRRNVLLEATPFDDSKLKIDPM
jgi:acetyltransferase-like isoleucine patch superfamily enzyme